MSSVFGWPQRGLMILVRGYRLLLKPWLGNACRFEPTCSAYTLEALQRHGALAGSVLGGWRILRCQPWCNGGHDPVPENLPGLFSRLLVRPDQGSPATPDPKNTDVTPAERRYVRSPTRKTP